MSENASLVNWYGEKEVRTYLDDDGQIWFIAKDVCEILGLSNASMAINGNEITGDNGLDENEKGIRLVYTPGGNQSLLTINESGLYSLIFKSKKEEAKKFKKWVTSEVLPEIRKTGKYFIKKEEMYTRVELMREIEKLSFKSMAQSLKVYGEAERTHGHAYSLYANLIYKTILGKTAKQIREENNLKESDPVKDFISKENLQQIEGAERVVDGMLKMGQDYGNIKFNLEKMIIKKKGGN
jgi:prophage antirepressor-like protein